MDENETHHRHWSEAWRSLHDEYFRRRDALTAWLLEEREKLRSSLQKEKGDH